MLQTRWFRVTAFVICCTPLICWAAIFLSYDTIPTHTTDAKKVDTIIVLGTPARPNGQPSDEQAARVEEGVREYKAGVAPYIIMTGGAAHNKWVEGQVMVDYAASLGVPREAMIVEGQAQDTIQNIWYSKIIMDQHSWNSAEVVSASYHLPRTGLILKHYQFLWKEHASHFPPSTTLAHEAATFTLEAVNCWKLRWHGYPHNRFIPGT